MLITAKPLLFWGEIENANGFLVEKPCLLGADCSFAILFCSRFFLLLCVFRGTRISKVHGKIPRLSREPAESLIVQDSREEFHAASLLAKLSSIISITDESISKLTTRGIFSSDLETLPFNLTFWDSYPWTHLQVFAVIEYQLYSCMSRCDTY